LIIASTMWCLHLKYLKWMIALPIKKNQGCLSQEKAFG